MKNLLIIFAVLLFMMTGCVEDDVYIYDGEHVIASKRYSSWMDIIYEYEIYYVDSSDYFILSTNQDFNVNDTIYITNIKPEQH